MFAEHPGQDRLGWAGAQGKKSSNLILMELGQRFVLQVKHQAQSTLQIRKTSQDRCSGINIPPNLCCYGARWCLGSAFTRLAPQAGALPCASSDEHPWHLVHGQFWALGACHLQFTCYLCKERSKGHPGTPPFLLKQAQYDFLPPPSK